MFTDDALGIGREKIYDWLTFHQIMARFGNASSLILNMDTCYLIDYNPNDEEIITIVEIFEIKFKTLADSSKYLGFKLKPCNYKKKH